jgi:hypothetical protein
MPEDISQRAVQVRFSTELLADLFTKGNRFDMKIIEGLPANAILAEAQITYDSPHCWLVLTFLHPSFDEIPLGKEPPIQDIAVRSYRQ